MSSRAIILAAGSGSRLMPYTEGRPKGMVALAGYPLLERQIATLRNAGINDITLVGGYLAWQMERYGCPIIQNPNYASTNMVASLHCAAALFDGSSDLVICYSDIVYEPSVLHALLAAKGEISVAADRNWQQLWQTRMEDPLADAESFRLHCDGRIAELGRKAGHIDEVEGQYIGLLRVTADAQSRFFSLYDGLDTCQSYEGQPFNNLYLTGYLQMLADAGWKLHPAWIENGWLEIDTVEDLQIYHQMFQNGTLGQLIDLTQAGSVLRPMQDIFAGMETFVAMRRNAPRPINASDAFDLGAFTAGLWTAVIADRTQMAVLDQLARKIEIAGRLYATFEATSIKPASDKRLAQTSDVELLLAFLLCQSIWFGDLRQLNTVVKALHTDFRRVHRIADDSPLLSWCDQAIAALTS